MGLFGGSPKTQKGEFTKKAVEESYKAEKAFRKAKSTKKLFVAEKAQKQAKNAAKKAEMYAKKAKTPIAILASESAKNSAYAAIERGRVVKNVFNAPRDQGDRDEFIRSYNEQSNMDEESDNEEEEEEEEMHSQKHDYDRMSVQERDLSGIPPLYPKK